MNRKKHIFKYLIADYITAIIAWALFFIFRKYAIEHIQFGQSLINVDFFLGITVIPIFWIILHYLSGAYSFILKKTVPDILSNTFKVSVIGVLLLFFTLLLDDTVFSYKNYYLSGSALFSMQFILTLIPRIIISNQNFKSIQKGETQFNTLIIGCGKEALNIYNELIKKTPTDGNIFIGYVNNPSTCRKDLSEHLPHLGELSSLPDLVVKHNVEEIIIAIEPEEHNDINEIMNWLGFSEVTVKAIPGLHNLLRGKVKITNILGTLLIEIKFQLMPIWQQALKTVIDFFVSLFSLVLLSPLFILCTLGIKFSSKGPIFFRQERIGKNGKPFTLLKFRSMYIDAEKDGPNLSKHNDSRITPFGKFLRSTKTDEIPNFINVLMGEMSLVGPRPERQYYIDQIVKIAPHYKQLQKIKPGITSLGQVKYGYAGDVEQMVKRLRYDIVYMENMSLNTDFLILYYTLVLLFKGRHV